MLACSSVSRRELVAQLLERRWSSQLEQLSCRDVDIDADAPPDFDADVPPDFDLVGPDDVDEPTDIDADTPPDFDVVEPPDMDLDDPADLISVMDAFMYLSPHMVVVGRALEVALDA